MTLKRRARLWGAFLAFGLLIFTCLPSLEARATPGVQTTGPGTGDWSSPQPVSDPFSLEDSQAPALAVTDNGEVHLVWEEGDELYHSYGTGYSWTTSAISGTLNSEQPAVAAGSGEQVHLVYVSAGDILYSAWDGSEWSLPRNVSQTSGASTSPDMAVALDGSIHLVALEPAGADRALYYATSTGGSSWPSYTPIPNAYGYGPSIDVTGTTTITVQIAYRESLVDDIYTVQQTGGAWSVPEAVTNTPLTFSTAPELALENGTAHIAWRETIDGTPQVQYTQGPTWTPVITLSQSIEGTSLPALALGPSGNVHAAWGDGTSAPFSLLHTWSSDPLDPLSWQQPESVDSGSLSFNDVVLVGAHGSVHAAWTQGADDGDIWYARWPTYRVFLPLAVKE